MAKAIKLLFLTLALVGCTIPRQDINPEGYLEIFGPASAITKSNLPAEWFVDGMAETQFLKSHLNINNIDGSPALILSGGPKAYVFAKRTKASLLATPFLSWSWNYPADRNDEHPLRLIIGFHGGDPKSGSWGSQPLVYLGKKAPPYDRAISIIWHRNAFLRGTINHKSKLPKYIARGGLENTDKWHNENLDLAALYKRIWPKDDISRVKIMYAGFAATKAPALDKSSPAAFADIVLSK
ncbi:MAG: DUF3047 domain-containing protein [Rhodospirillaceae bacterium]|jgi:hypothetical protein|nr:DUF3047 domain-containing protein [Rhodospirillaceae bacterium]MBT4588062.1 DUF3047 domain-containing protein [Rhodospirillaceae bacterium]MBT4938376.1 DUF3047 domain-containing protein [Rhodospirillaceae bacterium]MBT5938930.1 DUF3047 domain-containing protein [Rhodospirillaceae bacterium]MBT7266660.1 DUF3047 domain-containing protein [Rhodospirillaceae bacterium]